MSTKLGGGAFEYSVDDNWAQLPDGWSFTEVAGVAVDSDDDVYVFSRGEHPVIVFSKDGTFLRSWGEGVFTGPHGISIGPDDTVYLVDSWDHTVRMFDQYGRLKSTIGEPGAPARFQSGQPFNKPTHLAVDHETGDLFVADGYRNSRVHRFSPDGRHVLSWGECGTGLGQFVVPHNIAMSREGVVFVADRENQRVQLFDRNGRSVGQWTDTYRASCLALTDVDGQEYLVVGDFPPELWYIRDFPNIGPRVSIYDMDGQLRTRLGAPTGGEGEDQFLAPHGMAVDSLGDIYVGEASWSIFGQHLEPPREMRSLKKLTRSSTRETADPTTER